MSPKVLQRIALALFAALGLWLALTFLGKRPRDDAGQLTLPRLTAGTVDRISLIQGVDTVLLTKQGDRWLVNGLPASVKAVQEFLGAAGDSSAESELTAQSVSSHARLGVDSTTGRLLSIEGGGTHLLQLVVGNRGPEFNGFYVRRRGEAAVYLLRGQFAELLTRGQDEWRDRQVAAVPADSVASVEVVRGKVRWRLTKSGTSWSLGSGPADSIKVSRFLAQFRDLRAAGFPDRAELDSISFTSPDRALTVSNAAGQPLLALVFDSVASGAFWVRPQGGGAVYRLDGRTAGLITPEEGTLKK